MNGHIIIYYFTTSSFLPPVYDVLPDSFYPESKKAQMARMLDLHVNPITGLSSKYDYEKKKWKKKSWFNPVNPFAEGACYDYSEKKAGDEEEE